MRFIELAFKSAVGGAVSFSDKVVVAFSGGPDSMAVALLCARFRIACVLAHLDHAVRAGSADEEPVLRAFADRLGADYVSERVDVPAMAEREGMGIEEAGRKARGDFLERVRVRFGCGWILTGHQADDLAEDVLLRLIRGTSWPALGGMAARDDGRRLLRPLLSVPRGDVEAYVAERGERPLRDPTNDGDAYRRNRLRHHVVPLLKAENPALLDVVRFLRSQAEDDAAFWEAYLAPTMREVLTTDEGPALPERALTGLPRAARMRALAGLVRGAGASLRADALARLDAALLRRQRPKRVQFPGGMEGVLRDGLVTVRRG